MFKEKDTLLTKRRVVEVVKTSSEFVTDPSFDSTLIVQVNRDGLVQYSNQAFAELCGAVSEEIVGIKLKDVVGPGIYDNLVGAIQEGFEGREARYSGLLNFLALGYRYVEANIVPDTSGGRAGVILIVINSYHFIDTGSSLSHDMFLAGILNTAQDIVLVLDTKSNIVKVNAYFEKLTGYLQAEVEGKNWFDTFIPDHERARIEKIFKNSVSDVKTVGNVNAIKTKGRGERLVKWYDTTLKDECGRILGILAIGYDITEQRRTEYALRDLECRMITLAETLPMQFAFLDRDFTHRFVNQAYARWFNTDVLGNMIWDVFGEKNDQMSVPLDKLSSGERVRYEGEFFLQESERYIVAYFIPHVDDENETQGYIVLINDLTEYKNLEEKARRQQAWLAKVSRAQTIGEMASALAHELNQPLTAIANYAGACARLCRNDKMSRLETLNILTRITEQATRAGDIIQSIRRLFNQERPRRILLDINKVIETVVNLSRPEAKQHQVSFELDLADNLPQVYADEIQIQQVLLNLIKNGIEAMSESEHSRRELISSRSETDRVIVLVKDSGPGIEADIADILFKPFISSKSMGLGFGLSISRSIIEQHQGQLWLADNSSDGATFCFYLPAPADIAHN